MAWIYSASICFLRSSSTTSWGTALLVIEGPPAKVEDIPLIVAKDLVDGLRVAVLSGLDGLVGDPTITLHTLPPGAPAELPGLFLRRELTAMVVIFKSLPICGSFWSAK